VENSLRVLAPLLLALGIVLIVSGAVLALIFGHVAWQIIYAPEKVPVLEYILGHVPANLAPSSLKGSIAGQPFDIALPEAFTVYGTTLLMFIGFGMLLSVSRCLSGVGIQLVKAVWKVFMEPE
jgi:hypothetical protein